MKALLMGLLVSFCLWGCAPATSAKSASQDAEQAENHTNEGVQKEVQVIAPVASDGAVLARIRERGKLLVGTSGEQPPFSMKDKEGQLMGLEIDLARAFARSLELEVEFIQRPFGDLLASVEKGEIDLAFSSITMTPKRNMDVAFVGPYFVSGKALLTKDENLSKIEEPGDLDRVQMRLGAIKGSTSEMLLKKAAPRAQLSSFESYDEAVVAVEKGKLHALVADLPLVAVTLLRRPEAGFAAVGDPLSFEPIGAAVPAHDAHFHNLVGNYIRLMEGLGFLDALRVRWMGQADWLQKLPGDHPTKPLDPGAQFTM